ncbi:hypothetical protein FA13DRAFT_1627246 [Coprinellus micaceus]|uniref:Uncharacterized protein n=1 Tax=Coprinellus micaceus TaxID=71717 RepID=A0A4Y7TG93_COPMI|nr:hypothetical protein FA13DRAFT_1627246 [Coprinellus micaceus]
MFGLATESPPPSSPPSDPATSPLTTPEVQRLTVLQDSVWKSSKPNGFQLYKAYWTLENRPHDPDLFLRASDLREDEDDRLATLQVSLPHKAAPTIHNPYYPFPNWSSYKIGEWYWRDGSEKSRESFQQLIDIICDDDFSTAEVGRTNWKQVDNALASSQFDDTFGFEQSQWAEDGTSWKTSSITVSVPFNSTSLKSGPRPFVVENFRFRPLIPLIRAKLRDAQASEHFHIVPSELWWLRKDPDGDSEDRVRVYGDLYHSEAFLEEYRAIQLLPPEDKEDHLPRCLVAMMFASDDTMLASFGNAKLWPGYLHFGNESKYRRGRTSLKLLEEVAYFQYLPDSFNDWYIQVSGKNTVGDDILRHVKRELFHGQWKTLLDDEFIHAYEHGLVVDCPDGGRRRFYPRIMTYSADYPERVKVVGIRNIGDYPCARCLVPLSAIPQMGSPDDRFNRTSKRRVDDAKRRKNVTDARAFVYKKDYAVGANVVEDLLKPTSLVVAQNAFSDKLSALGFDLYNMIAPDILHEVEIGVWKDLFLHLLRLLEAVGVGNMDALNSRFRQIPSFGRDTIRRFPHNVSAMKQLGARDFEDLLQCSLPAFEGLFPGDHDSRVQDVLFSMAHWHALAKLRMHTDLSLEVLDQWTSILGDCCRDFIALTCSAFKTRELKREYEARKRREASKTQSKAKPQKQKRPLASTSLGRRARTWNIATPKFHALGDVVPYIKRFGTTDSYSTQWSESHHRFPKARYRRTNKKNVDRQLSQIQTRQARIKKLRAQVHPSKEEVDPSHPWTVPDSSDPQYFIGKSQNQPVNLSHFLRLNASDPATTEFLSRLKRHLFPRIIEALAQEVAANEPQYPDTALPTLRAVALLPQPSDHDLSSIYFHSDTIYRHNVLKVPYTTYDCRQDSDTLNPRTTRRDFMCLAAHGGHDDPGTANPGSSGPTQEDLNYVYGRILGIFHANVIYGGGGALDFRRRRFDFLWVRWFTPASSEYPDPWSSRRLDRVKLAPLTKPLSWGFVNPADVLRAAHVIPRFSLGRLYEDKKDKKGKKKEEERVPKPIFSKCAQDEQDWAEYYVNRFVDRDMVMRFHRGFAVGHCYSRGKPGVPQNPTGDQDVSMEVDGQSETGTPMVEEPYPSFDDGSDEEEPSDMEDWELEGDSGEESEGFYASEPDSEEEPDIYPL